MRITKLQCNYASSIVSIDRCTKKEVVRYLNKKYDAEIEDRDESLGTTFMLEKNGKASHIIWIQPGQRGFKLWQTISHESLHLVFNIMNRIGVWGSQSSEEAYTYLLDDLSEQIYKSKL